MFVDVNVEGGATSLKLGAIIPNENYVGIGNDVLQFLNPDGSQDFVAMYLGAGLGWYSGVKGFVDSYGIDIGTGFIANTDSLDVEYCIAGEVSTAEIEVSVSQGIAFIGNALPVTITLGEIIPSDNISPFGTDVIQFLKPDGSQDFVAMYLGAGLGWYSGTKGFVNGEELKPGEFAYAVIETEEGVTFTLPELVIAD